MYLITRRRAIAGLARAGELAGAAAVSCVRAFERSGSYAEAFAEWRPRPGKVALRARGNQWDEALAEPHALAGEPDAEAVIALPPRRRSERGDLLERLQAMSSALAPPPELAAADDARFAVTYLLNTRVTMSSGKTIAQIAHAAVAAADGGELEEWVRRGCAGRVLAPPPAVFDSYAGAIEVVDAGLTEVPPGTVTVRALPPTVDPPR